MPTVEIVHSRNIKTIGRMKDVTHGLHCDGPFCVEQIVELWGGGRGEREITHNIMHDTRYALCLTAIPDIIDVTFGFIPS